MSAQPVTITATGQGEARQPLASQGAGEDLALLRRFEPVIRYTRGERFFPMDVGRYVRASSLWMQRGAERPVCLVPEGQLSLDKLVTPRSSDFGTIYFTKFIEPLNIAEMAALAVQEGLAKRATSQRFRAGRGRLARVGYGSRFIDALFSITLLARGRVPGDTAAAAGLICERMQAEAQPNLYYGRVVRRDGWVALQYWFFYPFNNWRSGFFGVNDHEGDWEMIYVYLSELEAGGVAPEWVAYASHDFSGDDLRRRWDDPELEKAGEHPVIYAGAGSHASYYSAGDYLAEIELPFLKPMVRFVDWLQALGRRLIRETQGDNEADGAGPTFNIFRIPFVDYARGDGAALGPGTDQPWGEPSLLDESQGWALNYRGLWGLFASDPIAGENAPAGPVYNRDGSMRKSWYDPLGWAGLDKVPPRDAVLPKIDDQLARLEARRAGLEESVRLKTQELTGLGVEAEAMLGQPHLKKVYAVHQEKVAALAREVRDLRSQLAGDRALQGALALHASEVGSGYRGPARAHIHRAHHPAPEADLRLDRIAEFWAAISIGLMMVALVTLVIFARPYLMFGLAALIAVIIFVEASFRRQLARLVDSLAVALAVVATLILIFEFFWRLVVVLVLLAGAYIMIENLRELRS